MTTKFNYWKPKSAPECEFRKDFEAAITNGLDAAHDLPSLHSISREEFIAATMEMGYGPQHAWPLTFWMDARQRADLSLFLSQRAQSVVSMFDFDSGRIFPKPFCKYLESSEWSAMSYMVGQIGATVAVKQWLGEARLPIQVLHKSVFANAALVKLPMETMSSGAKAKAVPDLLVKDARSDWHLLEAKGGKANYRSRAVNKGLKQLDGHDLIRSGTSLSAPLSRVCSFVQLDRPTAQSRALRFDVVDPDGPNDRSELIVFEDLAVAMTRILVDNVLQSLPAAQQDRQGELQKVPRFTWRQTGHPEVLVAVPDPDATSAAIATAVAIMQATKRRMTTHGRRRIADARQFASRIVEDVGITSPTGFNASWEAQRESITAQVAEALEGSTRADRSLVAVWEALGSRLALKSQLDAERVARALLGRGSGGSTAVAGQSGAIYVSVPRADRRI